MLNSRRIVLVLHNIRSAINVGAMFRTADGAGVTEVWLTGYTPTPASEKQQYITKAEKALAKAALGAERFMVWHKRVSLGPVLRHLRNAGYGIVALEQAAQSLSLQELPETGDIALLVGNEVTGIDRRILKHCDAVVELPMCGQKNSLNVSVAAGIALYGIRGTMKKRKIL
jgi:tRNA G18 (ribose-2'-O)-methylase SpoU